MHFSRSHFEQKYSNSTAVKLVVLDLPSKKMLITLRSREKHAENMHGCNPLRSTTRCSMVHVTNRKKPELNHGDSEKKWVKKKHFFYSSPVIMILGSTRLDNFLAVRHQIHLKKLVTC